MVERIGWLIRLRWVAVIGVAAFLELARRVFPVELDLGRLYAVLGGLALYNAAVSLIHRQRRAAAPAPEAGRDSWLAGFLTPRTLLGFEGESEAVRAAVFASVQISVDLVLLALLLHFGGGLENPFLIFFVFHVIIASILLSRRATFFHATLGFVLIATVGLGECFGVLPLRLQVEDTGIGIPEADLPSVFEEFFRSANARERVPAGTGLGLAIVRSAAEQHGGTVEVASEPGRGTCFTVELPAAPAGDGPRSSAGPSPCESLRDPPVA